VLTPAYQTTRSKAAIHCLIVYTPLSISFVNSRLAVTIDVIFNAGTFSVSKISLTKKLWLEFHKIMKISRLRGREELIILLERLGLGLGLWLVIDLADLLFTGSNV